MILISTRTGVEPDIRVYRPQASDTAHSVYDLTLSVCRAPTQCFVELDVMDLSPYCKSKGNS